MTLTPKKHFQVEKLVADRIGEFMHSIQFHGAINVAMMEMILNQPVTTDPVISAANHQQILGARAFINQLLNIAEVTKAVPQPLPTNLDHQVK